MRNIKLIAGLVAGLATAPVFAANLNIAVADSEAALKATNVYKQTVDKLQAELKPQRDKMNQLKTDIDGYQTKFQKDGAVMSDADKKKLQQQAEAKIQEYNNVGQSVEKQMQDAQNSLLQRMVPEMEKAIDGIQKVNHYDIIIEKRSVIFADPTVDITKKITEKLNAATASGAGK
jgi:Skp family chaperone for outer membrane proteins